MKIAMIIAFNNFRDEEYLEPQKLFVDSGYVVRTFSTLVGIASGRFGAKVDVDDLIDNLDVKYFDAVVFVGGGGAQCYIDNKVALNIASESFKKNIIIAAICMAPAILAHSGVTKGRKSTVFPDRIDEISSLGVEYIDEDVVVDSNIITARDYSASVKFAETIINALEKR